MIQRLLFACLLLSLLANCARDTDEARRGVDDPQTTTITLKDIVAEIDASSFSAIGFEIGEINKVGGGKGIGPKVKDLKEYITEHGGEKRIRGGVIISNGSTWASADVVWIYKEGYIDSEGVVHKPTVTMKKANLGFLREGTLRIPEIGESGYYMSGYLGDFPNYHNLDKIGHELKGVDDDNPTGERFRMFCPFATVWTPVTIVSDGKGGVSASINYKTVGGEYDKDARLIFKPMGSLIGYQFGNEVENSTFTPKGFVVISDAFTDEFEKMDVLDVQPGEMLRPKTRIKGAYRYMMSYTFHEDTLPGVLEDGEKCKYRYYAWVYPLSGVSQANTKVILVGEVKGAGGVKHECVLWKTDYTPKGTGRPKIGAAHTLRANARKGILLPIQAMMEYNLAGGGDMEYFTYRPYYPSYYPGAEGVLRFANSHDSQESGFYNWWMFAGEALGVTNTKDANENNPNNHNLLTKVLQGETTPIGDKYYVPDIDDWGGIIPAFHYGGRTFYPTYSRIGGNDENILIQPLGKVEVLSRVDIPEIDNYPTAYLMLHSYIGELSDLYKIVDVPSRRYFDPVTRNYKEKTYTNLRGNHFCVGYYVVLREGLIKAIYLGEEGAKEIIQKEKNGALWSHTLWDIMNRSPEKVIERRLPDVGYMTISGIHSFTPSVLSYAQRARVYPGVSLSSFQEYVSVVALENSAFPEGIGCNTGMPITSTAFPVRLFRK